MFYFAQLPVFGELAPETELDRSVQPPVLTRLSCRIDMLPWSDIFAISPCVIVSARLARRLDETNCSGYEIREGIFNASDAFHHFHGFQAVPELRWLHVSGRAYTDDFGFAEGTKLIVSDKAKATIEVGPHRDVSFLAGDKPPSDEEIESMVFADVAKVAEELRARKRDLQN